MKFYETIFPYPVYALSPACDQVRCYGRRLHVRVCKARCEHYPERLAAEERLMMHRYRLRAAAKAAA
jgi:hypothetical protein